MATTTDKTARLTEFQDWVGQHIKGDEKGEAQLFLDRLFRGFGWPGLLEASAGCEVRIRKESGGTSFADLVWKPRVLIEMKKRGTDLRKHYSQAFAYWFRLVPRRPRYVVLCNFDEFWVYDFETQVDTPVDTVALADLPRKYGPLNFMYDGDVVPVFGNHQESVTRLAADKLAACFNSMRNRGVEQPLGQRFILQILMALFAEDIGLLERYFVTGVLDECKSPQDTYDLLGNLFAAMNTPGGVQGGRFKGVAYFNGGLFAEPARVELVADERLLLKEACQFDWSKVRPEIFGTIFEHSLGKVARHATGAHFTSAVDIMKVVGPTIVQPWTEQIESAKTLSRLRELLHRIENFTVLDPACGSGNFLYVAYRELKRLEARIYERMAAEFKSVDPRQRPFGFLSTRNFYGIDINPFAVEVAKVTMMLAHKLSIDELQIVEAALPLDNLERNFRAGDALVNADGSRAPWFPADVMVGNPPFLDARKMTMELGRDYVRMLAAAYPEIPRRADLCTYWFRRAHDELKPCIVADPMAGRAGLVGTQNIRNNDSRIGGLDHIATTGTIVDAVDNQPWSGEANVHVSIANWINTQDTALLPARRALWFKLPTIAGAPRRARGTGTAAKQYELDMREVAHINSALSGEVDVSAAHVLPCNRTPKRCFEGIQPGHDGFRLTPAEFVSLLPQRDLGIVAFPYLNGTALLTGNHKAPSEYVIDFQNIDVLAASRHAAAFALVRSRVLPLWQKNATKELEETGKARGEHQNRLQTWWRLKRRRGDLVEAIRALSRYAVCSRVTKRPIFAFVGSAVRPDSSLTCFAVADDYSFGVLQSSIHAHWFVAKCSKLTERLRYTPESVFDTFPWPQTPTAAQVDSVAEAGRVVRQIRADAMEHSTGGLRALYRTLDLPGKNPLKDAHTALDAAVLEAYGFSAKNDILQQLLDLNAQVAGAIERDEPVTGPGVPASYTAPAALVTSDCMGS